MHFWNIHLFPSVKEYPYFTYFIENIIIIDRVTSFVSYLKIIFIHI